MNTGLILFIIACLFVMSSKQIRNIMPILHDSEGMIGEIYADVYNPRYSVLHRKLALFLSSVCVTAVYTFLGAFFIVITIAAMPASLFVIGIILYLYTHFDITNGKILPEIPNQKPFKITIPRA